MIENNILWQDLIEDFDENTKVKGFIEVKRISLEWKNKKTIRNINCIYSKTNHQVHFNHPALVLWELDSGFIGKIFSGNTIRTLKPVDFIELTEEQAKKIKKWIEKKN